MFEKNRKSDKRILILRNTIQTEMTVDTAKQDEGAFCSGKRPILQSPKQLNADDIECGSSEIKKIEKTYQNATNLGERQAVTNDESETREEWEV